MKQYSATQIRNIALAGHGGSGKTSLAEAMLYLSGATDRLGKIADGNTVLDFDSEEKRRKTSVQTAVAPVEWQDRKINLIDTPGLFDFVGGVCEAMRVADTVVITLSGKSGLTVGAEKAYKAAKKRGAAVMFFVSKLDSENADFFKVLQVLEQAYGAEICPVMVPRMEGHTVTGYADLMADQFYTYASGKRTAASADMAEFSEYSTKLNEAIASTDEELMDKFFSEEPFTAEEKEKGITNGVKDGSICPVFCGSGLMMEGVDLLLDALSRYAPSAADNVEIAQTASGEVELKPDENGPLAAIVFKTIADPFVGKLSYFRVVSGKLSPDTAVINARTGSAERIAKVMVVRGAKQEETAFIPAGDIGAVAKLATARTGDTLCAASNLMTLEGVKFPMSCLSMALFPKKKGEEDKIVAGLNRLAEEDPTIEQHANVETHEQIVSGMGEQHLDVAVSKLKSKFGVEVELSVPRVAYRETIRKKVKVQGRHKKQSGGHGQYGDVWIEFESCDGDDLVFEEKVFGGAVPRNFFPAVEKGLRDSMVKGPLAGYPVVGIRAVLVDGSYHPVDSSEMSFKLAAGLAFKSGMAAASPTLLEPIGTLKALVPDDNMGDIIGDINKRRGRVLGMNPAEDRIQEIVAEVPMAEMGDFSTMIRSITQGRGSFALDFERYEDAPPVVAKKVIEEAKERGDID